MTQTDKTADTMSKLDTLMETLSTRLSEGKSEALLEYLRFSARFYHYSANNQLLIWLQAPNARFVAGFHDWHRKFGRHVKKGEKSITILAPVTRKVEDERTGETERRFVGMKTAAVFADYQTEGDDLPTPPSISEVHGGDFAMLQAFSELTPIPTVWEDVDGALQGAHGYTDGKKLVIDRDSAAGNPGHALRIFFHEWAHYELHICETGRREGSAQSRATRELEADAAAYALCAFVGVDTYASTGEYITGWGGDPEALKSSLSNIQKAVVSILKCIQPQAFAAVEADREAAREAYQAAKKAKARRKSAKTKTRKTAA